MISQRDQRVRVGQQELSRALSELEGREHALAQREASFEADSRSGACSRSSGARTR